MKNNKKALSISLICVLIAAALIVVLCTVGCEKKKTSDESDSLLTTDTAATDTGAEETTTDESKASDTDTSPDTAETESEQTDTVKDTKQMLTVYSDDLNVELEYPVFSGTECDDDLNSAIYNAVTSYSDSFIQDYRNEDSTEKISLIGTYSVTESNSEYISVLFTLTYELGGAHPSNVLKAVNYSVKTKESVGISHFLGDGYLDTVANSVYEQICENPDEYYDDVDVNRIRDCFGEENFVLTETGITVFFAEYDLAPHASGVCQFDLHYIK